MSVISADSFSFAPLGLFIFIALFPGAYAPGYALLRPFGPNDKENIHPISHRGLINAWGKIPPCKPNKEKNL